ncbi:MerR family transcriptional regulator [Petropleomorpha daqingensis]|uniref:DNA-binding transcriptional MerR regulator n=1 Tax=Petropleomorpha daqingensis TaxID=2026353 RepID=A0A853CLD6_9ACTN|nr:DNA-binding transcriptional MerR regulator [Petropleomorpha daqingensis]
METTRLSVGQLAAAAGMTAKALRHYDRIGLFAPDDVDDDTGYRWYGADRLPQARLIARLRSVGVPLDDVAACVAEGGDPDVVDRVLADHRRRLESRLVRVRGDLHRLAHLADDLQDDVPAPTPDLPAAAPDATVPPAESERQLAVDLFNGVWRLMETEDRTPAQDDRMLHMAHASRYHWEQAGTAVNLARGEWQCSRVYAVLGRAEPARHHARRVLEICEANGIGDWDLAFAHEALARAAAVAGDPEAVDRHLADARRAAELIADPADRELLESDLASIPAS